MKIVLVSIVLSSVVAFAACRPAHPGAVPVPGSRPEARDLTFSTLGAPPLAVASALELDRPLPVETARRPMAARPRPRSRPSAPEPAPVASPVVESAPAASSAPSSALVSMPMPTPPAPAVAPAATDVVARPVASGSVLTLEPGQTVTALASPMAGSSAAKPDVDVPSMPSRERGPVISVGGGGSCPHGGRGGGVIGILR